MLDSQVLRGELWRVKLLWTTDPMNQTRQEKKRENKRKEKLKIIIMQKGFTHSRLHHESLLSAQ